MRNSNHLLIAFLACAALHITAAELPVVKLTPGDTSVQVDIGGKPFTTYRFGADEKPPFVRPFFYPVLAADGVELTSDQIRTDPKEHPHHRSFWVGHGEVNGIDHWSFAQKPAPPKQRHIQFDKLEGDGFVEQLMWDDLQGQPLLNEVRTVRFIPFEDGARGVDITVKLTATSGEVTLADTKEAGLAAVRVSPQISAKPTLINSAGADGEKQVWGKPADWCDESGVIDGKPYGVAIFDHPSNPRHPTTWHSRGYGLIAPNEFGLHEFDKKLPKGAGDLKIQKGESVSFRYRVIIHEGAASDAKLSEKYKDFSDSSH